MLCLFVLLSTSIVITETKSKDSKCEFSDYNFLVSVGGTYMACEIALDIYGPTICESDIFLQGCCESCEEVRKSTSDLKSTLKTRRETTTEKNTEFKKFTTTYRPSPKFITVERQRHVHLKSTLKTQRETTTEKNTEFKKFTTTYRPSPKFITVERQRHVRRFSTAINRPSATGRDVTVPVNIFSRNTTGVPIAAAVEHHAALQSLDAKEERKSLRWLATLVAGSAILIIACLVIGATALGSSIEEETWKSIAADGACDLPPDGGSVDVATWWPGETYSEQIITDVANKWSRRSRSDEVKSSIEGVWGDSLEHGYSGLGRVMDGYPEDGNSLISYILGRYNMWSGQSSGQSGPRMTSLDTAV